MEAWVTSVLKDDLVTNAVVLATSLRKTGTKRKIAVIVSPDLSAETQILLGNAFDCVFVLQHVPTSEELCMHAKIFAFSLCIFAKCVYISPDCLVLENAETLFEGGKMLKLLKCDKNGLIDWSIFMFTPNKELWQHLVKCCRKQEHLNESLQTWLETKQSWRQKTEFISDDKVAQISLANHVLLTQQMHAPIIHFVDVDPARPFLEQIKLLRNAGAGILERAIADNWLKVFLQAEHNSFTNETDYINEPVAIVGMSCRYPGASSLEEFWNLLKDGREAAGEPPSFRWTEEHTHHVTEQERKTIAGFLKERVDEFDAKFFGASPKDMAYMDPQVRLLHEVFWEALEDSGTDPLSLHGTHTGVFTGSWLSDYREMLQESKERDFYRSYMGVGIGAAAARLSFLLGLTGPCIATESGCSSAMVALDLAVKSLRGGETNLAVVGGVNLLLRPFTSNIMEFVVSPDGRSKTFDAEANGFGRAEGCGVLVLKRLGDALKDNDKIWATIRGCAVAQEGPSRSFGTPTVHCEALAMKLALEDANVAPEQVSFVETHGTGTRVGDPIEVNAIAKAYYSPHREEALVIGSVKTNVGHTESCSGITGIMKVVLSMQNQLIPKHLNFKSLNPEIFLDCIPAMIPLEPMPWTRVRGQPRIAGVSSFGITGTDGHVIIQEAPDYQLPKLDLGMDRTAHILKISAKSSDALKDLLERYQKMFAERAENKREDFGDAAFSANVGRAVFGHRAFLVAENYHGAAQILWEKRHFEGEVSGGNDRKICFLFTGQGSQYVGMATTLYDTSPVFRIHFDACERILRQVHHQSICDVLWESEVSAQKLNETISSQTSIFCVEYALFKLWQSWGINPDYVLGHSLGEFCAAVVAGILTLEDALALVVQRSKLIDSLPRGSMLVISRSESEVMEFLQRAKIDLDVAAVNTAQQTVVSGDSAKVHLFLEFLKERNIKSVVLGSSHAFHSRHMDPMLEKYREMAASITPKQGHGHVQYVSGLEGRLLSDNSHLDTNYWVRHTREPVRFIEACNALQEIECLDFVEIGSQPILSSFLSENIGSTNLLPSLRRGKDDWHTILHSLGKLFLLGHNVDWKGFDGPYSRKKVSLPFHPFHRKGFWMECNGRNETELHPILGHALHNPSSTTIFKNDFSLESAPFVRDHRIGERIVFPGAAYVEMCLSAGQYVASGMPERLDRMPGRAISLSNFRIEAPLEIKEDKSCQLQVLVDLSDIETKDDGRTGEGFRVRIYHQNSSQSATDKWVLHASSIVTPVPGTHKVAQMWKHERISEIISNETSSDPTAFYIGANEAGLKFGKTFKSIQRYWTREQNDLKENVDEVVVEMALPPDFSNYLLHPLIIDAVFQSVFLTRHRYGDKKFKVPIAIGQLTMLQGIEETSEKDQAARLLYIHTWNENGSCISSISSGCNQRAIALAEDIQLIETNVRTIESILEQQSSDIADAWEETWKPIPCTFNLGVQVSDVEQALSGDQLQSRMRELRSAGADLGDDYKDLNRLLYLYILNAFLDLGWQPPLGEKVDVEAFCDKLGIKSEFYKLVHFYFGVLRDEAGILQKDQGSRYWKVTRLPPTITEVQHESNNLQHSVKLRGKIAPHVFGTYENISENLAAILSGKISALSILFPTDEANQHLSADSFYQNHFSVPFCSQQFETACTSILENSVLLNPPQSARVYRVLEVGSGTGSLTFRLLTWLKNTWGDRFELYFTDLSQYFFVKAQEKFAEFDRNIKYAVFNIEESPLSQCIPLGYFDMVCAAYVLHATRDLEETLVHLRQTLRPGGVLCFTETVKQVRDITFVFGLLEGYWRFQDFQWRPDHCCVELDVWERLLSQTGFSAVHGFPTFFDQFAVITAVATSGVKMDALLPQTVLSCSAVTKGEWVIFTEGKTSSQVISSKLAHMLIASGFRVLIVLTSEDTMNARDFYNGPLDNSVALTSITAHDEDGTELRYVLDSSANREKKSIQRIIYICGMDMADKNDIQRMALPALNLAKVLVGQVKPPPLLVVTRGVQTVSEDSLNCHPNPATVIGIAKTLKNEHSNLFVRCLDCEALSTTDEVVAQLLHEMVTRRQPEEQTRVQVAYRNGIRHEPKLVKVSTLKSTEDLKLPAACIRYHLVLPQSKLIHDLQFDTLDEEQVGETEVEVKVKAWSLNFKDVLTVLKPSAEFEKLNTVGLDFSGIVTKAGPSACFVVGDSVFGVNTKEAQLPSHVLIDSQAVLKIPEGMTHWEAATLPAVFSTAYHCLVTVAKMKRGDTVLIHTASGGVGLAAIQLAKHVGATLVTTAGNERKRAFLKALGVDHVFHSRDTSYEQGILMATEGRGVDIVLNSITGPGFKEATLRCCARNARFIEMSKLSVWTPDDVRALRPDVYYQIVDLTTLGKDEWSYLVDKMQVFLSEGQLKPLPYIKFDALRIRQALQYFQKAKHIGKVVCTMPEVKRHEGQIQVKVPLFSGESTYMITGGLGGIGFEVCKWMLEVGATDLVLVGRSPPKPEMAAEIEALNGNGLNVQVKLGDIGDYQSCKRILQEIEREGKPLRGVMHCAGVLRDNLLTEQTWKSFEATFNPKVNGTWNLHNLTVQLPLEHFVMFSSVTALLGSPSQSNHVAANCFEDAFIHYRHSLGLPGTTINWGQWAQVGVARELNLPGLLPVSVKRMLNGLEIALKAQTRQICLNEFYSYEKLNTICCTFKNYLDKKHWKEDGSSDSRSARNNDLGVNTEVFWDEIDKQRTRQDKIGVFSAHIKVILRAALCLNADEAIEDNANLQELGVDSLLMIELKNSIQNLVGSRLSISASLLSGCESLGQIAGALVDAIGQTPDDSELISNGALSPDELFQLLRKDFYLPQNVPNSTHLETACRPSKIKTVLVTGASGRLATHIIAELLVSYESIKRVICLLRKGASQTTSLMISLENLVNLDWARQKGRVECISGGVTIDNLGLSLEEYTKLCRDVDAVIHCAVKTNLSEAYKEAVNTEIPQDIRSVNVGGTLNILKFASTHKTKHVYYPSTFAGVLLGKEVQLSDDWPVIDDAESGLNINAPGFIISKCVGEGLMKQANERGIPCKVFRFPEISGKSKTGQLDFRSTDYLARYKSFLRVGAMPSATIPANFVPVDLCADFSLKLFLSDETPFEIFNIGHPSPQLELDFVQLAKQEFGKELQVMGWNEFLQQVQNMQQDTSPKDLSRDVKNAISFLTGSWGLLPQWKNNLSTFFKNEKLVKFIPNYEQRIPDSMEIVKWDLTYLRSIGQLNDFGL